MFVCQLYKQLASLVVQHGESMPSCPGDRERQDPTQHELARQLREGPCPRSSEKAGRAAQVNWRMPSHFLGLLLVFRVVIVVVSLGLLVCVDLLGIILLLLLSLLDLAQCFPLLGESVSLGGIVCDHDVVEDGATFDLPQVEADEAE